MGSKTLRVCMCESAAGVAMSKSTSLSLSHKPVEKLPYLQKALCDACEQHCLMDTSACG